MPDRSTGAVVLVLGVVMLAATRRLPPAMLGDPAGPTLLPLAISWTLIALGAALALRRATDAVPAPVWAGGWRLAAVVALLALYTFVFTPLGYLAATTLVMFLLLGIYNPRRTLLNGIVAVTFSAATYLLFHRLLGVYVPVGLIG